MTELERWHHPSYEERWTNYGCICRFLKGIQHGRSHQDSWKKMHKMGFPKLFQHWILSYTGERREFVQVNDRTSELTDMQFGVPQGSILGPAIFYFMQIILMITMTGRHFNMQTKRRSWSTVPLQIWMLTLENWIAPYKPLKTRLSNSNLLLNAKKTKQMMIYTEQMSSVHKIEDQLPQIRAK